MAPYPPPYGFGAPPPAPPPGPNFPASAPSDGKAVLSLVLGILSFFICGLTGIPAIVLGFSAKGDIRASGGMIGGGGLATAGIVTGFAGTAMTMLSIGLMVFGVMMGARSASSSSGGPSTHHPAHAGAPASGGGGSMAPAAEGRAPVAAPATFGSIRVVDLDPEGKETFHQQLSSEFKRAVAAKQTVLVMTSAKWCSVCREFEDALPDPRMQTALANVSIVRVDIDDFDAELKSEGMLETTLPWFYKLDATLRPVDAISAGEWDDNLPENMAPVLKAFMSGTLRARRDPSKMGTAL